VYLNINVPTSNKSSKFITSTGQAVNGSMTPYIQATSDFYNSIIENWLFEGDTIDMNQIVPDELTITDFLTNINKMFNLYWVPDGDKNFIIEPRDVLYSSDDVQILDWTTKTQRDSSISIQPLAEVSNKEFVFTYKQADDYYNELYTKDYTAIYGEKKIEVLNDFIEDTKKIELSFQPTIITSLNGTDILTPAYVTQQEGFFESIEPKLRILVYGGLVTATNYFLFKSKDYPFGLMNYNYPFAGHIDNPNSPTFDINFGQCKQYYYNNPVKSTTNLFNKYWLNTITDLISSDSHIWTGILHLNPFDIITMNLFDTIQMDQVYYKINKIEYDPTTELAKVELVKTNSFLTKPNATIVKPSLVTTTQGWGVWSPWGPSIWEVDGTLGPQIAPFSNPQWAWQNNVYYSEFKEATTNTAVGMETIFRETNDEVGKNVTKTSIHRNTYASKNFIQVKGKDNFVADDAVTINMLGNNNKVFGATKNIQVLGDNNVVDNGVTNVTIIGNNIVAKQSNVTYINGVVIKNGDVFEEFSCINGGVNNISTPLTGNRPIMIKGGKNSVMEFGSTSQINYINGGINIIQTNGF